MWRGGGQCQCGRRRVVAGDGQALGEPGKKPAVENPGAVVAGGMQIPHQATGLAAAFVVVGHYRVAGRDTGGGQCPASCHEKFILEESGEFWTEVLAGRTFQLSDAAQAGRSTAFFTERGIGALVSCPLTVGGELKGMVNFSQREKRDWEQEEVRLVKAGTDRIANASNPQNTTCSLIGGAGSGSTPSATNAPSASADFVRSRDASQSSPSACPTTSDARSP